MRSAMWGLLTALQIHDPRQYNIDSEAPPILSKATGFCQSPVQGADAPAIVDWLPTLDRVPSFKQPAYLSQASLKLLVIPAEAGIVRVLDLACKVDSGSRSAWPE